jgi:hypothetical protein
MTHTTEPTSVQQTPEAIPAPARSPRQLMPTVIGWVAIAVGLIAALLLIVLTFTSGQERQPTRTEQPPAGSPAAQPPAGSSMLGVPRSADAAERYLAGHTSLRPAGVPRSADAAERYLAQHNTTPPAGVPQSADAAERYLAGNE